VSDPALNGCRSSVTPLIDCVKEISPVIIVRRVSTVIAFGRAVAGTVVGEKLADRNVR